MKHLSQSGSFVDLLPNRAYSGVCLVKTEVCLAKEEVYAAGPFKKSVNYFLWADDVEVERHDDVFTNVMHRRVFTIGTDEIDSSARIATAG